MNNFGIKQKETEGVVPTDGMSEIPSYPVENPQVSQESYPQQDNVMPEYPSNEVVSPQETIQPTPVLETQNSIPKSSTPELQTPIERITSKEGELAFQNLELGQSTFKGGVTTQQLVSKVAGYYSVNQGLVNDPHSGLLQKTASSGDPTQATTWQATVLYKILQAFWKSFGL